LQTIVLLQTLKEAELQVKQLSSCADELNKFTDECTCFKTWMLSAEDTLKATRDAASDLSRLQELKDAHKVVVIYVYTILFRHMLFLY